MIQKNRKHLEHSTVDMVEKQTLVFGAADTSKSITLQTRGKLISWVMKLPNFTNSVTGTLSVANGNSDTLWADAARADNQSYYYHGAIGGNPPILPLVGVTTFTVTLSGVPGGAGGNVELTLYVE